MRYNSIIYNDTANGEGNRVTIFCQGCHFKCEGCHNYSLWDFDKGEAFTTNVLNTIFDYFHMFEHNLDGLSLLGGEPFDNLKGNIKIANEFVKRFPTKSIWIYSGYTYEEIIRDNDKLELLQLCDVLVDGQFKENLKDKRLRFRGSSNQRIIDIADSLLTGCIVNYKDYYKDTLE